MQKKIISVLLVVAMSSFALSSSSADSVPDEQWSLKTNAATQSGQELQGIEIQDHSSYIDQASNLVAHLDPNDFGRENFLCMTYTDATCSKAKMIDFSAVLPACTEKITTDCIAALNAISSSGAVIEGKYVRGFPEKGNASFSGDPLHFLPTGASPSLWNIPGVINGGGTENYIVDFLARGGLQGSIFSISDFSANVSPVSIKAGNYGPLKVEDSSLTGPSCVNSCGIRISPTSSEDVKPCASVESGSCALKQAFRSGFRFQLIVRLSSSPTGWFHGRLKSPIVNVSKDQLGYSISVTAEPVKVPEVGILVKYADLSPEMKAQYEVPHSFQWGELGPNGRGNALDQVEPNNQTAFDRYTQWSPYFNDRASASPSLWTFRTLETNSETSKCFTDASQFQGVVTTNAMIYAGGPPTFDSGSGTLDYKVGSPHFTSTGEVFLGTYDLQIRSDIARCLYQFTNAPIKATISISNGNGSTGIATTSVTETDGWLRMSAYGFTFSNPTIKVKLSQDAPILTPVVPVTPEVPVVIAKPVTPAKKITITCVKGKTSKKISAIKPTCPTGYKKK